MAATRELFHTSAIELAKGSFRSDGILHTDWLMPARFSCQSFMNNPRYLPEEVVPANERHTKRQPKNVKFVDIGSARSDYTRFDAVTVRATHNTSPGEKLLVNYGENYE